MQWSTRRKDIDFGASIILNNTSLLHQVCEASYNQTAIEHETKWWVWTKLQLVYGEQVPRIVVLKILCSLISMEHAQTRIFICLSEQIYLEKDCTLLQYEQPKHAFLVVEQIYLPFKVWTKC
jgi:hypothetical protein